MTKEEAIRILKYNSNVIHKTINGETDSNEVEALDMAIKALEQEPIAEERYQDLVEYFGDKDIAKCVLEDREEFKKWIERIKWHVRKTDELARKLEQEPRWIPVSERLPEKNVEVLVTTEWDCITIGEMFSNNDWFIHEGATNSNIDDIKAWMPLPQPYSAESEGKVMTIGGAISELNNLLKAEDIPTYYKPSIKKVIETIEQEPKTGHWREDIDKNRSWDRVRFYCSECGDWQTYGKSHYCPDCGAEMRESEVRDADSN